MKYILFGWNEGLDENGLSTPIGGAGDYMGVFDGLEDAKRHVEKHPRDSCHIALLEDGNYIAAGHLRMILFYDDGEWWEPLAPPATG